MAKQKKTQTNKPVTTPQRLGSMIKSARDLI
jgi:hypothetical protein